MSSAADGRNRFRGTHPVRRVELGGARWEYFAGGKGRRGLLVLGCTLSFGDSSHRIFGRFEQTHRVLAPSYPHLPGVGEAVDGLAELCRVEGLEEIDVFGQGLGAGLAHVLVRRHPDRIGRIALTGFGLLTPFRSAAARALVDMLELMPQGAVRHHFEHVYNKHAEAARDANLAREVMELGRDLLERHSRESALHRLRLQADLFRGDGGYQLDRPVPARALLFLASDDPSYLRQEQDNLERSYPGAAVVRHANGGRLLGSTPAPELESQLDAFFRGGPELARDPVPALKQVG